MGRSVAPAAAMQKNDKRKEGGEKNHWESRIMGLPDAAVKMTEASCAKCHKQQLHSEAES
jgi:hypothetical protein